MLLLFRRARAGNGLFQDENDRASGSGVERLFAERLIQG